MSDIGKKLSELLSKVDDKVLKTRLNTVLDSLQKGDVDDLSKKLNKIDKNDLLDKLNQIDDTKLKELNIDKTELRNRIDTLDLDSLSKNLGDNGPTIIAKIKNLIEKR